MRKYVSIVAALLLSSCAFISPPPRNLPARSAVSAGESITVKGDKENVYTVARANKVSMRDLIVLNNLQPPYRLHDGQRLTLPAGGNSAASGSYAPAPVSAGTIAVEQTALPPPEPAPEIVGAGSVTPRTGMGQSLRRGGAGVAPVTAEELSTPSPAKPIATTAAPETLAPHSIKPPEKAVTAAPSPPPEEESATPPPPAMIWPVQGPILSGFGPKGQGLNNDGINIGAPKGAPVVAALGGTVVYAGNEMKGFGNLVLIRHPGGWVTAYAHLARTLVAKDAVVAQGDMIGTVGSTGGVSAPQLHFETRYQSKPIDPAGVIKTR